MSLRLDQISTDMYYQCASPRLLATPCTTVVEALTKIISLESFCAPARSRGWVGSRLPKGWVYPAISCPSSFRHRIRRHRRFCRPEPELGPVHRRGWRRVGAARIPPAPARSLTSVSRGQGAGSHLAAPCRSEV